MSDISFRAPRAEDVDDILKLIVLSTQGKTSLTKERLFEDLFVKTYKNATEVKSSTADIEIDTKLFKSDCNVIQMIVAEEENSERVVGYLLSHNHYSPWSGNCRFIDDVYVSESNRKQGEFFAIDSI